MKIIKINSVSVESEEIDLIVDYLKNSKVIAYPTDTIYGLGCAATDEKAIKKIYKIKQISKPRPFIILVNSLTMLKKYSFVNQKQAEYLKNIWPGPVTVILKSRSNLPTNILGADKSIAARLPKNDFLIKIIKRLREPLVSTSLNLSGQKNLTNLSKIKTYFKRVSPDLAVDIGPVADKRPSRIVDLRGGSFKIIRH